MRNLILLLIFTAMSNIINAQYDIDLNVEGVPSNKGTICYAIYNDASSFLKLDKVFKSGSEKAIAEKTTIKIKNLPEGDYAIAIFHDANGNEKLDTNMLGIPKEPIAFSKGKLKMFGPPKFEECVFTLTANMELKITLE